MKIPRKMSRKNKKKQPLMFDESVGSRQTLGTNDLAIGNLDNLP